MLINLQDTFYQALMTHNNTFGLILDIVYETMPRDNLLNSACLELFEFIKRENIKPFVLHVVEKYHDKLKDITYVDTFQDLILRYEQMQGYGAEMDSTLFSQEETPTRRIQPNGQRWHGVKEMDAAEEEYFDTSDDEDQVGIATLYFQVALIVSSFRTMRPSLHMPRMVLPLPLSSPWLITRMMMMIRWMQNPASKIGKWMSHRRSLRHLSRLSKRLRSDCQRNVVAKKKMKTSW